MSVHETCHAEYKQRHDEIWPELVKVLKQHGARNYSIYLEPQSSNLFAYVEIESEEKWNQVADTEVCKKWWRYMKDIMPSNPDNSPVAKELRSVFYME